GHPRWGGKRAHAREAALPAASDFREKRGACLRQPRLVIYHVGRCKADINIVRASHPHQLLERRIAIKRPPFGRHGDVAFGRPGEIVRRQLDSRALVVRSNRATSEQKQNPKLLQAGATARRAFGRLAASTKNSGTNSVAMQVAASIPPTTPVPI